MKRVLLNEDVVQVLEENILKIHEVPPETLTPIFQFIREQDRTAKPLRDLATDAIRTAEGEEGAKMVEELLEELKALKERFG